MTTLYRGDEGLGLRIAQFKSSDSLTSSENTAAEVSDWMIINSTEILWKYRRLKICVRIFSFEIFDWLEFTKINRVPVIYFVIKIHISSGSN